MSNVLSDVFENNEYHPLSNAFAKEKGAFPNVFWVSAPSVRAKHFRGIMAVKKSENGGDFPVSSTGLRWLCGRQDAADGPKQCYVVLFEVIEGRLKYVAEMTAKNVLRIVEGIEPREPSRSEFSPYWFFRRDFTVAPMPKRYATQM